MQPDVTADLESLDATLTTVEKVLDLEELRRRIDELEMQASDPELWNDQDHAQKVTSELSHAQAEMRRVTDLRQRLAASQTTQAQLAGALVENVV